MTQSTLEAAGNGTGLTARVPGSKSITNRALLLAAAAVGTTRLRAPLVSEDTLAFREALVALGHRVETVGDHEAWDVTGTGRGPVGDRRVWCADAGTAARFLPPFAATGSGTFTFEATAQLRARPMWPMADALAALGAKVTPAPDGGLPLTVVSDGLSGGRVAVDSSLSSQFLSGLMINGPLMGGPLTLTVEDGLVSRPYIDMTVALMRRFNGSVAELPGGTFEIRPGDYTATDLAVEPDASTASYFFAAAAVTGTRVTVPGLGRDSLQGDLRFAEVLRRVGAEVEIGADATTVTGSPDGRICGGFRVDMGEISDTFMTLAAIAPLADAPLTISGIGHARLKESDRIAAVARNLGALGVETTVGRDWITIHPAAPRAGRVDCHRDHRIGMAFSVLGLRVPGITLDEPACVAKTFPGFHDELGRLFPAHAPSGTGPAVVL